MICPRVRRHDSPRGLSVDLPQPLRACPHPSRLWIIAEVPTLGQLSIKLTTVDMHAYEGCGKCVHSTG